MCRMLHTRTCSYEIHTSSWPIATALQRHCRWWNNTAFKSCNGHTNIRLGANRVTAWDLLGSEEIPAWQHQKTPLRDLSYEGLASFSNGQYNVKQDVLYQSSLFPFLWGLPSLLLCSSLDARQPQTWAKNLNRSYQAVAPDRLLGNGLDEGS